MMPQSLARVVLLSAVLTLHATAAVDGDLFTGPPPAPGAPPAKTAPDPTPTEWDLMLEQAQWPPITLPATTITQEQGRKQRLAWWRAHGFDAQLALCKGQPDEKDVRDFFDEFLPWFAGTGLPIPAGRGVKRCLAITAGEGRRAMVDFLAGCYLHAEKQYTPP